jgi:hypothetical protein
MSAFDRSVGIVLAVAATAGIVRASHAVLTLHPSPDAVLRLAWSARPERMEDCRPQTDEELSKLPAHMRQAVVCEGVTAEYRLEVRRNGAVIAEQVVRGGGLRHDRPLYVFREIPVPADDADIEVRFVRLDSRPAATVAPAPTGATGEPSDSSAPGAMDPARRRREAEERQRRLGGELPSSLAFHRRLSFSPRDVILVTYDPERRELLAVERSRK